MEQKYNFPEVWQMLSDGKIPEVRRFIDEKSKIEVDKSQFTELVGLEFIVSWLRDGNPFLDKISFWLEVIEKEFMPDIYRVLKGLDEFCSIVSKETSRVSTRSLANKLLKKTIFTQDIHMFFLWTILSECYLSDTSSGLKKVEKRYLDMIKKYPEYYPAKIALIRFYIQLENLSEAIKICESILAVNCDDQIVLKQCLGIYLCQSESEDIAINHVSSLNPKLSKINLWSLLGSWYFEEQEYLSSIKTFTYVIDSFDFSESMLARCYHERGLAYLIFFYEEDDIAFAELAHTDFSRAIELDPQDIYFEARLMLLIFMEDDRAKGDALYLIAKNPNIASTINLELGSMVSLPFIPGTKYNRLISQN